MTDTVDGKPITPKRIERAMDRLVLIMDALGKKKAAELLPIYERLEKELEARRAKEDTMSAVEERIKRLRDRKAERLTS